MDNKLEIKNLTHFYESEKLIIDNISLNVSAGQIISLLGPSGCGKTTLLRIIAGLEKQKQGSVLINNQTVSDIRKNVPPEKRNLGLVVQEKSLFPHLNILKNVTFGIQHLKNKEEVALSFLKLFRVDNYLEKFPHEISGGEQQRVALARALAPNPEILLLDEPFNALDEKLKDQLYSETKKIFKENGLTVLMVTHDRQEAELLSDKILILEKGKIESS